MASSISSRSNMREEVSVLSSCDTMQIVRPPGLFRGSWREKRAVSVSNLVFLIKNFVNFVIYMKPEVGGVPEWGTQRTFKNIHLTA